MEDKLSTSLSPGAASRTPKLRLPATCDPPTEQNPPKQAIWVVFGATGHVGQSLVRAALSHGDKVTAVGWTEEDSPQSMELPGERNYLGTLCDVRVLPTVQRVVSQSIEYWGRIDIVANCSGYGVIGACEDQDEFDLRNQFDTNVLGTINIISATLPTLRAQLHGRYLIFSSTSGALGVPGLGPYCASKYAVEGLVESMLYEVDAFNIKATLVEPGHIRRDDPDTRAGDANRVRRYGHFLVKGAPSEHYGGATAPAGHAKRLVQWFNDRQPTSAVRSAELVWQLAHCSYPPLRLLLGSYAVDSIRDRMRSIIEEIEDWKHLNFPVAAPDDEHEAGALSTGVERALDSALEALDEGMEGAD